jgi:hypothetical protein
MAEPGGEMAAGAGGAGDLRASHAERDQVIGLLKAAFVQGRLTKDEFDVRVGQALMSRTRVELAGLTADMPAGLAGVQPPEPAGEWSEKKAATAVIGAMAAWWSVAVAASLWVSDSGPAQRSPGVAVVLILLPVSLIWIWLIAVVLEKRASRRSARDRSPGGCGQAAQIPGPVTCH